MDFPYTPQGMAYLFCSPTGLLNVVLNLGVSNRWTGFSTGTWDWNVGLDYLTGMWDWTTGLVK